MDKETKAKPARAAVGDPHHLQQHSRLCDVCSSALAALYCAADDAYVCVPCDAEVHNANPLSQRHERVRLAPNGAPMKMDRKAGVAQAVGGAVALAAPAAGASSAAAAGAPPLSASLSGVRPSPGPARLGRSQMHGTANAKLAPNPRRLCPENGTGPLQPGLKGGGLHGLPAAVLPTSGFPWVQQPYSPFWYPPSSSVQLPPSASTSAATPSLPLGLNSELLYTPPPPPLPAQGPGAVGPRTGAGSQGPEDGNATLMMSQVDEDDKEQQQEEAEEGEGEKGDEQEGEVGDEHQAQVCAMDVDAVEIQHSGVGGTEPFQGVGAAEALLMPSGAGTFCASKACSAPTPAVSTSSSLSASSCCLPEASGSVKNASPTEPTAKTALMQDPNGMKEQGQGRGMPLPRAYWSSIDLSHDMADPMPLHYDSSQWPSAPAQMVHDTAQSWKCKRGGAAIHGLQPSASASTAAASKGKSKQTFASQTQAGLGAIWTVPRALSHDPSLSKKAGGQQVDAQGLVQGRLPPSNDLGAARVDPGRWQGGDHWALGRALGKGISRRGGGEAAANERAGPGQAVKSMEAGAGAGAGTCLSGSPFSVWGTPVGVPYGEVGLHMVEGQDRVGGRCLDGFSGGVVGRPAPSPAPGAAATAATWWQFGFPYPSTFTCGTGGTAHAAPPVEQESNADGFGGKRSNNTSAAVPMGTPAASPKSSSLAMYKYLYQETPWSTSSWRWPCTPTGTGAFAQLHKQQQHQQQLLWLQQLQMQQAQQHLLPQQLGRVDLAQAAASSGLLRGARRKKCAPPTEVQGPSRGIPAAKGASNVSGRNDVKAEGYTSEAALAAPDCSLLLKPLDVNPGAEGSPCIGAAGQESMSYMHSGSQGSLACVKAEGVKEEEEEEEAEPDDLLGVDRRDPTSECLTWLLGDPDEGSALNASKENEGEGEGPHKGGQGGSKQQDEHEWVEEHDDLAAVASFFNAALTSEGGVRNAEGSMGLTGAELEMGNGFSTVGMGMAAVRLPTPSLPSLGLGHHNAPGRVASECLQDRDSSLQSSPKAVEAVPQEPQGWTLTEEGAGEGEGAGTGAAGVDSSPPPTVPSLKLDYEDVISTWCGLEEGLRAEYSPWMSPERDNTPAASAARVKPLLSALGRQRQHVLHHHNQQQQSLLPQHEIVGHHAPGAESLLQRDSGQQSQLESTRAPKEEAATQQQAAETDMESARDRDRSRGRDGVWAWDRGRSQPRGYTNLGGNIVGDPMENRSAEAGLEGGTAGCEGVEHGHTGLPELGPAGLGYSRRAGSCQPSWSEVNDAKAQSPESECEIGVGMATAETPIAERELRNSAIVATGVPVSPTAATPGGGGEAGPLLPSTTTTEAREARLLRYWEKKRTRQLSSTSSSNKIRYQVRKLNADRRPRIKGRFVKRGSS